jgi:catechol 2,3-dioxygenase-like lactoylglutathione lyase family enzyme
MSAVVTPAARVTGLAHVAIKCIDLDTTIAFYEQVIGLQLVPRPPFPFPGAWLGLDGEAWIHLYGGDRALAPDGSNPHATGSLDHVSLWARGYAVQRTRFENSGLPFRETQPPQTTLAQMFVLDPNGVLLELTFDLRNEPGVEPGTRSDRLDWSPAPYTRFARPRAR